MKKTFIFAVAILAIFLAGCTAQLPIQNENINQPAINTNQNTNQPSTDNNTSKTYKNQQYGFEFQYPQSYSVYDSCVLNDDPTNIKKIENAVKVIRGEYQPLPCTADFWPDFLVSAVDKTIDLSEKKTQAAVEATNLEDKDASQESIKFLEENALKITASSAIDGRYVTSYYLNHNNRGYIISWSVADSETSPEAGISKMLSTFRFTK